MKTTLLSSVSALLRPVFVIAALGLTATVTCRALPAGTPVTRCLTGQNYWYAPPDSSYTLLKDSGVTLVRIGGHAYDVTPLSDADLLRQVDNIRSIGAEPIVQLSRYAPVQTAVNTLTYLNVTNARAVRFWSIGNEPDLGWSGTDADLTAYVAGYIKQYAPALRDVDPGITILAPDFSYYNSARYGALLGGAADITGTDAKGRFYIDGVTFHRYPFGATYARSDVLTEMHSSFEGRVNALLNLIASANALHGRSGSAALTWGVTEFNLDYANPANNTPAGLGASSFLNGQFFAEYYRVAAKRSATVMNTWSMLEGGGSGSTGDLGYLGGNWSAPVKRSSYYHLQMVARYMLPGGYLATTSSAANLAAWSTSSADQAKLAVMVLNEDTAGSQTFTLRFDNDAVAGPGVKVNVAAGLPREYSATIGNQTTAVLVFDASGALQQRVIYSLANCQSNQPPQVESFSPASAAPGAPGPITAAVGDAQVMLAWPAVPGATGYNVKRAPGSGGPYATIAAGVIGPTFSDAAVTNGVPYFYVVSAVNSAGEGADSDEAGVAPQPAPPTTTIEAEALPVTVSGSSVSVNPDSAASGGKWVHLNATAAGAWMQFTTGTIPAGSYTLQLTYKANNNRGQLALSVDGTLVGSTIDEYASATAFVTKSVGAVTFATSGVHTVRLTATGRNSASTGYLLSADKFSFAGAGAVGIALAGLHQTYDGTPKPVSATTTPAGVAVALAYDGAAAAPAAAGVYQVSATVTDPSYYGAVSSRLAIAKADATVTLSNLDQTYDGTPKTVTAATLPAGLAVELMYVGSAAPVNAGNYPVMASIMDANYHGSATGTLVVRPAIATVTLGGLVQSYDGTPKTVAVTTSPAGLPTLVTYAGSTTPPSRPGSYPVVATVSEPNFTGAATGLLTIADTTPPVLRLPDAIVVEASSGAGAPVVFEASALDNVDGVVPVQAVPSSGSLFPLGRTDVAVSAVDLTGNRATGSFAVTVRDTTAPTIAGLSVSPAVVWPANHKLVPIRIVADFTDAVGVAAVRIVSIASNEPGDDQWKITGPLSALVRAERDGNGSGRIYTVTVEARDAAGNARTGPVTVAVPHDRGEEGPGEVPSNR